MANITNEIFIVLILLGSTIIVISPLFVVAKEDGRGHETSVFSTVSAFGIIIISMGYLLLVEKDLYRSTNKAMAITKEIKKEPVQAESDTETAHAEIVSVPLKNSVMLDAPVINQFPELPRGCEVTSLAMLLQYEGIDVGKMELAELVVKNPTPLRKDEDEIFWGHPNDGFIGNMYTYSKPGYGVYHKPIKYLAENFLPGRVIDLTGSDFGVLKYYLSAGKPVWVITNTTFKKLPENYFETWQTPSGEVQITYKQHSVLITGYDEKYIYFNDPIGRVKNKKISVVNFKEAWVQMGSQAISYFP
jgi:uncharacterized protein YvpB